jgi:hypothetical protein
MIGTWNQIQEQGAFGQPLPSGNLLQSTGVFSAPFNVSANVSKPKATPILYVAGAALLIYFVVRALNESASSNVKP